MKPKRQVRGNVGCVVLVLLLIGCYLLYWLIRGAITFSSLHQAAVEGDTKEVERLLESGMDVNIRQDPGRTPLHYAAREGHIEVVQLLLDRGADIDAVDPGNGWTPLHFAASRGHRDIVEMLSSRGAGLFPLDRNRRSPAEVASSNGHEELAEFLHKAARSRYERRRSLP